MLLTFGKWRHVPFWKQECSFSGHATEDFGPKLQNYLCACPCQNNILYILGLNFIIPFNLKNTKQYDFEPTNAVSISCVNS